MDKTIKRIVDYAGAIADPSAIYLFGSMAEGRNTVFSDLDLLIVTEQKLGTRQISALVTEYARQFCLPADVLVYSSSELNKALVQQNSFIASVLKTAKKVYEKP